MRRKRILAGILILALLSLLLMGFTVLQIKYISRLEFRTAREDDK